MPRHVSAGLGLLVVGVLGLVGFYFLRPTLEDWQQRMSSDASASAGTVRIGTDSWVGYFPLCSPVMRARMRDQGYRLRCEDDAADYPARMRALREGDLELAVATVDSYLQNGAAERFPANIVAVIDESKGGDAIVARKEKVPDIDALKAAADPKVAFTPASPSEHLLRAVASHFDIPLLLEQQGAWRVETNGSEEARRKLESGAVDVAVLWEPDVSRATASGEFTKLLGTEDTAKLIVDVLLASREFQNEEPELLKTVLHEYFRTLKHYRDDPAQLRSDLEESTGIGGKQIDAMLAGVAWINLHENATRWFGVKRDGSFARDGIVDAIEAAERILVESGAVAQSPLPDRNPDRILHSAPIALLSAEAGGSGLGAPRGDVAGETPDFEPLSEAGWARLREVGTLKIRPITFRSGTGEIGEDGRSELDKAAEALRHYPNFRIVVKGHTGTRGDAGANRELSSQRAKAVARYLKEKHAVDPDRLRSIGRGGSEPLPRQPGESDRAYSYRLPRVELFLVDEVI